MSCNHITGIARNVLAALCMVAGLAALDASAAVPAQEESAAASTPTGIVQFPRGELAAIVGPRDKKAGSMLAPPGATLASTCLQKSFPVSVSGAGGVAWIVCVTDMGMKGLWVGPVYLQRGPGSGWMQVLYEAGLAEIFVPYHSGSLRSYELRYTSGLAEVTREDAGSDGELISLVKGAPPTVVAEVRERGVAWLCKQRSQAVRRGEEFVVWGVSDAGDDDNIIQYTFRDDGGMAFRVGHTGYNAPDQPKEGHMHTSLWRIDMDLNGSAGDTASLSYHFEPYDTTGLAARDEQASYGGGREGPVRWTQLLMHSVLIEDNATNALGNRIGYQFVHERSGTALHFGPGELWTRFDFYVTRFHGNELGWLTAWQAPDDYLIPQINNRESVINQDLVVWMKTSVHHAPQDEDNGASGGRGVALARWSGFTIEPHNLFAANPLGEPEACDH